MENKEILKKKIQESFIIKIREGEKVQDICDKLSDQFYKFIIREPGFTNRNVSRGIRGIVTEQNRDVIIYALEDIYFDYIIQNSNLSNKYDVYARDALKTSSNISKTVQTMFSDEQMIKRMSRIAVETSLNELQKKQKKNSEYLKTTAQKSTPKNNSMTINMLATSQRLINGIRDYSKKFGYDKVESITKLEKNINKGVAHKEKNRMYNEDGMAGVLNIGEKMAQEDSILMLSHPQNKDFKIAMVADGIGGHESGDKASYIATALTMDWFKKLPKNFYNSDVLSFQYQNGDKFNISFEEMIKRHLININDSIVKKLGDKPGTTFSAAITRKKDGKDTITSVSIGDSKILKISENGQVQQLSKDYNMLSEGIEAGALYVKDFDSYKIYTNDPKYVSYDVIYRQMKNSDSDAHILNEGDTRFYKKNNLINSFLGAGQKNEVLEEKLNRNTNDYITECDFNKGDKILLCSDGVSDNLSNHEIGSLVYTFGNSNECLKNIINVIYNIENKKEKNRTNNPPNYLENNDNFYSILKGNQDNISAVIIENESEER